ncbi:MAG: hypothetical protein AUI53_03105 [Acidobacteria bacterium 13_1_40CM_2_60_7]|nr:MAG: hypothetical protein AUI53_03105 [Acidobacteria bacterium 13_1_40CM_2_60_7]OLE83328.1 MAG: hypothetical protein AUG07_08485 [Acidobacteria bacterium 13_1_20CM_2_60_10]
MKPQTANSVSLRCLYRTPGGRQCRLSASGAQSGLCPQHRAEQKQEQAADHYLHLITNFEGFQTAQGINLSLGNLFQLLAKNRISPRRAAVLAYISSLLLRTLPQIDADRAAGITDPTKPPAETLTVSAPQQDAVHAKVPKPDSGSGSRPNPAPGCLNTWDPSSPEPDPKKKPS